MLSVLQEAPCSLCYRYVLLSFWVGEFDLVTELLAFLLRPDVEDADLEHVALKSGEAEEHFAQGEQRPIVRVIGTNNQLLSFHYSYEFVVF